MTTFSPIIVSFTGGWGVNPSPAVSLAPRFATQPNIVVGTVVPEPSVFVLGALGVSAVLMLRRRK